MPSDGAQAGAPASAASHDWSALADLESLRPALWRLAYRFCWNAADADDAVQDALLKAAERRGQLADATRLDAWLRAIVVRRCQELRRTAARRRSREQHEIRQARSTDPINTAAMQGIEVAELSAALRDAILALPERQQSAIVLRHLEGLEYDEIAQIMEVTAATVRVQVRDAREALRRRIFDDAGRSVT